MDNVKRNKFSGLLEAYISIQNVIKRLDDNRLISELRDAQDEIWRRLTDDDKLFLRNKDRLD